MSAQQTDRALWFNSVVSAVDLPKNLCRDPLAFSHYQALGGAAGTTFLCRPKDADDQITAAELASVRALAAKLNAQTPQTFAYHAAAGSLKCLIAFEMKRDAGLQP